MVQKESPACMNPAQAPLHDMSTPAVRPLGDGALLVDKPAGVSSYGVLLRLQASFKKNLGLKIKFGHGGTLDPFASGLLIVFFGQGLKLSRYFLEGEKSYEAVMSFGSETASGDPTTPPLQITTHIPLHAGDLAAGARTFCTAPYAQIPSMYSAKKMGGLPLYSLARAGVEVEREARVCTVSRFDIHDYAPPLCRFSVDCSSGTYVRTLAADFARRLGSLAHLQSLRRTACCAFGIRQSTSLNILCSEKNLAELQNSPSTIAFDHMLPHINAFAIDKRQQQSLLHGHRSEIAALMNALPDAPNGLLKLTLNDNISAIARKNPNAGWQLDRVFHWDAS